MAFDHWRLLNMERDYQFLIALPKLGDEILVGVEEVAAITGYCPGTIRHRRIKDFPSPLRGSRLLRWQLGHIREWIRVASTESTVPEDVAASPKGER
jgi:predicted DNA-binding transcriptional regulator AlpA